ncbi:hypothetical protein T439DRAFT_355764 [Meredithblackwellia eburnea MCA 4105]
MPTSRLPDELYTLIIDELANSYGTLRWRARDAMLATCCLVSKTFLFRSQRRLYEALNIEFEPLPSILVSFGESSPVDWVNWSAEKAFALVAYPHLSAHTIECTIAVTILDNTNLHTHKPAHALATALRTSPRIRAVSIFVCSNDFRDEFEYFDYMCQTLVSTKPHLDELKVFNDAKSFPGPIQAAAPLLPPLVPVLLASPHLTSLTISGFFTPPTFQDFNAPFQLSFLHFEVGGDDAARLFDSITSASNHSLRDLELGNLQGPLNLRPFQKLSGLVLSLDLDDSISDSGEEYREYARRRVLGAMVPTLRSVAETRRRLTLRIESSADSRFETPFVPTLFQSVPMRTSVLHINASPPVPVSFLMDFLDHRRGKEYALLAITVQPNPVGSSGEIRDFLKECWEEDIIVIFGLELRCVARKPWTEPDALWLSTFDPVPVTEGDRQ